jgi:CheY-like chemotaxis protein
MDVRMPYPDGLEVARRLASLERARCQPHVPVIAIIASAMPNEIAQCFDAGVQDVVVKPYLTTDLQAAVIRWGHWRG